MIGIRTNINVVTDKVIDKLKMLTDTKNILRPVAVDALNLITKRIHEDGKAADGQKIGTYSPGYMYVRKKFGRGQNTETIVSLTRQLENDWAVIGTKQGWGIGFNNPVNSQKMKWVEERKNKKIAALTEDERTYSIEKFRTIVNKILS